MGVQLESRWPGETFHYLDLSLPLPSPLMIIMAELTHESQWHDSVVIGSGKSGSSIIIPLASIIMYNSGNSRPRCKAKATAASPMYQFGLQQTIPPATLSYPAVPSPTLSYPAAPLVNPPETLTYPAESLIAPWNYDPPADNHAAATSEQGRAPTTPLERSLRV